MPRLGYLPPRENLIPPGNSPQALLALSESSLHPSRRVGPSLSSQRQPIYKAEGIW